MDNSTLASIREAVEKNENIGIVVGRNPNMDSMASALSLYLALRQINKNVSVACPTDPLVEVSSLIGIDKVKRELSSDGGDLIVSFPYKEGEIEKVSYTLDNGYLNIVVKQGEEVLSFDEKDIKYQRKGALPTLLFVIATPRLSDLGLLFDPTALKDTAVVNIDNKSENQGFGDISYVSSKFSSVSEMIADFIMLMDVSFDRDMAQNLLSGIIYATDNFQDQRTSSLAFEVAALLMRKGAERVVKLRKEKVPEGAGFEDLQQFVRPLQTQQQVRQPGFPQQQQARPFPKKTHFPPRTFPQPQQQQQPPQKKQQKDDTGAPADWLTPKVYKGSTHLG